VSTSWRSIGKRIKNWLIYILIRSGLIWIRNINRITAIKLLQTLSLFGFYLAGAERRKTIKHLTMVYGREKSRQEIYQMAKAVFVNLGRNVSDAIRVNTFNTNNIDRYIKSQGLENLDRALKKRKGVLAITGHIGNWELMGAYLSIKGYTVNVVGAPIYDPRIDELVVKNRLQSGLKYIARGSATRDIIRALRRNEIVGLLIDQDTKHVDGVFIEFLGETAYTPVGPVILAIKTGATIVPMAIHFRKDGTHFIQVEKELTLKLSNNQEQERIYNTQLCSNVIEKFIRKFPTQWVWMHERWKTRPGQC